MKQQTLQNKISLEGKGIHTGKRVSITLCPAAENTGIQFQRIDIAERPIIKADVTHVESSQRSTILSVNKVRICTVEHLLAALSGMEIDNVLVEMDAEELPIMDGSAAAFVQVIQQAGIITQEAEREYYVVEEPIVFKDDTTGAEFIALPADKLEITALIDFNTSVLGRQYAEMPDINQFSEQIAPARTFAFLHELKPMMDAGLIQGGDVQNAVVFVSQTPPKEDLELLAQRLNVSNIDILPKEGILNTTTLRFDNEPARHKIIDVLGDLTLLGKPLRARIIATKPGHSVNVKFARKLKDVFREQQKLQEIPRYDPNKEPVFDNIEIAKRLQHRFPFLLIDKIIEISDKHVVGVKNVTVNEPFFPGHFPGNPIMPGVLQIEALAQTGGILVMGTVENPHEWDTYFLKIDKAVFRHKVVPGDTLIFKMELIQPIRRGLCLMAAKAFVGNKLVTEAELLAQIIKRK